MLQDIDKCCVFSENAGVGGAMEEGSWQILEFTCLFKRHNGH